MKTPETSVIIRTRNEAKWLPETLNRLARQTYQDFEIIVVDSGSTDNTVSIANSCSGVRVVEINPEDFTYPYAINFGIKAAKATKYFVILSAHSLPSSETWLESGIKSLSLKENVAGVYGPLLALPGSTLCDKLFHGTSYLFNYLHSPTKQYRVIREKGTGVLGFTNAIIRKDLWQQYPINEDYAGGGEDSDWAQHWLDRGYIIMKNKNFTVLHSHNLGPIGWYKQLRHWKANAHKQKFKYLDYRKDGAHQD